ncbi:MAG: deoxyribose-phosphate aldolase, partial [Bacteroides sp.]
MEKHDHEENRYALALSKYNTNLKDEEIKAKVAAIIEKKVPENNTEAVKRLLFNCIDL